MSLSLLIAIAVIYFLAIIGELMFPNNSLFDFCNLSLPPLATFILGYHLGTNRSKDFSTDN